MTSAAENIAKEVLRRMVQELGVPILERLQDLRTEVDQLRKIVDGFGSGSGGEGNGYSTAAGAPSIQQRVLRAIRGAGEEGITLSTLARKTQLIDAETRHRIIQELAQAGQVDYNTVWSGHGHGKIVIRALNGEKKSE